MDPSTGGRRALRVAARLWWSPVVAVGALVDRGSRARWLMTPGIVVLAASASTVGKLVIRRPRPGAAVRAVPAGRLGAAGFPSTHATCAFAIAGWQRHSRGRWWLHLIAAGIGYSRVRSGAHHYVDVAAGAALGYGISLQCDAVWSVPLAPGPGQRVGARTSAAPRTRSGKPSATHPRGAGPQTKDRGAAALPAASRRSLDLFPEHQTSKPPTLEVA